MGKLAISGTFLDEISHDIPSANWGEVEWRKDFDAMKSIGIDTVIIIRAGYKDKAIFNSEALQKFRPMRPVYADLLHLFLDEAERCEMNLYFGVYDSGQYWLEGDYEKEIEINKYFTEEVITKYGDRNAFAGWYASHELHAYDESQIKIYVALAEHMRQLKDLPILMSPYIKGRKQFENAISPDEHQNQWDMVLSRLTERIDIIAFQDGQVDFYELPTYMAINTSLTKKYNIISWSNVETFERGMPINFLPIAWPNLRYKMEAAENAGVEKLITFEFSHFLSPNSMYPSAHNLYRRYVDWLASE